MSLIERGATNTADANTEAGAETYRVVDAMDETGRMTVRAADGTSYTVVGTADRRISERLTDRAPGATVRLELSPAPSGTGYVVGRVLPGGLPAL
jgi:prolyl-tRNA editing enzyme YbaK/EbsC (Cys-tRNA(Pro) deacylase)